MTLALGEEPKYSAEAVATLVSTTVPARIAGNFSQTKLRSGAKLVGSAWPGGADTAWTQAT